MIATFTPELGWVDDAPPLLSAHDHAFWMSSMVFDGARAFDTHLPDLKRHCARLIHSAKGMLLEPTFDAQAIDALCREGVARFPKGSAIYIRPMFYATGGFVMPDPASTQFTIALQELAMPGQTGVSVCFSSFRRPSRDAAPTDTKSGCLYPNMQRALKEAQARGFDNAITSDPSGNIAELTTANLWIVKDGVALTPYCNGTFLNGITRQRVLQLLRDDGVEVKEVTLTRGDVLDADELFSTGNYGKVMPIVRLEDRDLQAGPIYRRAHQLYQDFAAGSHT